MSSKATSYLAALQHLVISQNTPAQISNFETAPCPSDIFHSNWARYPGNTRFGLKVEITIELHNQYMDGKVNKNKNRLITAENTYDIILDTVLK